jgi:hypothetical protein
LVPGVGLDKPEDIDNAEVIDAKESDNGENS